jgi:hypothetical protein
MAGMDANSVDAIVTDPPYGLSFMGKGWDKGVPGVEFWVEALRVAKPGAHLLAFGGTRMVHRLAVAIEDAGWEIRDRIHWVYGSGFPKSHNVSKAIDKAAGAERGEETPHPTNSCKGGQWCSCGELDATGRFSPTKHAAATAPATPAAKKWDGWGTALKPAVEPIILARKPFKGTVAANVLEWGTGAINVDGCRVGTNGEKFSIPQSDPTRRAGTVGTDLGITGSSIEDFQKAQADSIRRTQQQGRFPANLIHDGSDEATAGMGDASRYFYCAKASKKDRDEGLREWRNTHPTVKPTDLMAYLCRLVTPPSGTVLDPFNGSGSTGKAAVREGFNYIGCELDPDYVEIARARIEAVGVPA